MLACKVHGEPHLLVAAPRSGVRSKKGGTRIILYEMICGAQGSISMIPRSPVLLVKGCCPSQQSASAELLDLQVIRYRGAQTQCSILFRDLDSTSKKFFYRWGVIFRSRPEPGESAPPRFPLSLHFTELAHWSADVAEDSSAKFVIFDGPSLYCERNGLAQACRVDGTFRPLVTSAGGALSTTRFLGRTVSGSLIVACEKEQPRKESRRDAQPLLDHVSATSLTTEELEVTSVEELATGASHIVSSPKARAMYSSNAFRSKRFLTVNSAMECSSWLDASEGVDFLADSAEFALEMNTSGTTGAVAMVVNGNQLVAVVNGRMVSLATCPETRVRCLCKANVAPGMQVLASLHEKLCDSGSDTLFSISLWQWPSLSPISQSKRELALKDEVRLMAFAPGGLGCDRLFLYRSNAPQAPMPPLSHSYVVDIDKWTSVRTKERWPRNETDLVAQVEGDPMQVTSVSYQRRDMPSQDQACASLKRKIDEVLLRVERSEENAWLKGQLASAAVKFMNQQASNVRISSVFDTATGEAKRNEMSDNEHNDEETETEKQSWSQSVLATHAAASKDIHRPLAASWSAQELFDHVRAHFPIVAGRKRSKSERAALMPSRSNLQHVDSPILSANVSNRGCIVQFSSKKASTSLPRFLSPSSSTSSSSPGRTLDCAKSAVGVTPLPMRRVTGAMLSFDPLEGLPVWQTSQSTGSQPSLRLSSTTAASNSLHVSQLKGISNQQQGSSITPGVICWYPCNEAESRLAASDCFRGCCQHQQCLFFSATNAATGQDVRSSDLETSNFFVGPVSLRFLLIGSEPRSLRLEKLEKIICNAYQWEEQQSFEGERMSLEVDEEENERYQGRAASFLVQGASERRLSAAIRCFGGLEESESLAVCTVSGDTVQDCLELCTRLSEYCQSSSLVVLRPDTISDRAVSELSTLASTFDSHLQAMVKLSQTLYKKSRNDAGIENVDGERRLLQQALTSAEQLTRMKNK